MIDDLINMLDEHPCAPPVAQELAYRILQRSNSRDAAVDKVLDAYSQNDLNSDSMGDVRAQIFKGMDAAYPPGVDITYRLATAILNPPDLDGHCLEYFIDFAETLGMSERDFEELFKEVRRYVSRA